jgi:hypothetical protein
VHRLLFASLLAGSLAACIAASGCRFAAGDFPVLEWAAQGHALATEQPETNFWRSEIERSFPGNYRGYPGCFSGCFSGC